MSILRLLADRPVAYHPDIARIFGGVKCAVFLCQMLYWTGKGKRTDGFIWKTADDIEAETGLTRREQETVRKHLKAHTVLVEKLTGVPATLHFKVNLAKVESMISAYYANPDSTKAPNWIQQTGESIPETTTEIIPEKSETTVIVSLSQGQQKFLRTFGAKRFANNTQKAAVLELEQKYPDHFYDALTWCAERGFSRGAAISAMRTALPKWDSRGKRKAISRQVNWREIAASSDVYQT
jgi:hypothetical protein